MKKNSTKTIFKSAEDGKIITKKKAQNNPKTTYADTVPSSTKTSKKKK